MLDQNNSGQKYYRTYYLLSGKNSENDRTVQTIPVNTTKFKLCQKID